MKRIALFAMVALAAAGCATAKEPLSSAATTSATSDLPQGSETVDLDPADFTADIDNPWWPMTVGGTWVYNETDAEGAKQKVVVTVTDKTKKLANGIEARVVRDEVTEDGVPVELTDDYYAQDRDGNIWYMGEATQEFDEGKPGSTDGSFEAGKDGAQPGIAIPAKPQAGMTYRQEYYKGEAEDQGEIIRTDVQAEAPFGHFENVVMTMDTNPLEPDVLEFKFYAKDVGPVVAITVSGGSDREELVRYTAGR
jgi:hypothetical protein